jgi:hypothetical protein
MQIPAYEKSAMTKSCDGDYDGYDEEEVATGMASLKSRGESLSILTVS